MSEPKRIMLPAGTVGYDSIERAGGGFDASATRIAGSDLSPQAFAGILRTLASQLENEDRTKESAP